MGEDLARERHEQAWEEREALRRKPIVESPAALKQTITCPHCGRAEPRVYLQAPATVVTVQMVGAEVELDELAGLKRDYFGRRDLPSFRLDERIEVLDSNIEHYDLELSDERLLAFCWQCNGDVTEAFRALLNKETPDA